ncbi:hypothetical protein V7S79_00095 [Aquirufa sp. ROCK-SH2]
MKSPNIFLHYWANKDSVMTFQDILGQEIQTEILDKIQVEIQRQLNSNKLPEIFPCFDWENERFVERWEALSKTLVLQVQLPQEIWENWINDLLNEEPISMNEIAFNPFEDPQFAHFTQNENIDPFLSAEVYFQKLDELEEMEEMEERREEREERKEDISEVRNEENVNNEPKNILEQLQAAPEEKFFETIAVSNSSLKNLVESKMTEQLSETISINQKIQFILQLFAGDSDKFNELIEFIDQESNASNWQNELNQRYISYQNQDNLEAWKDLYLLVQRKFN